MRTPTTTQIRCPACSSTHVMSMALTLAAEKDVRFAFCSNCEWKGWGHGGKALPLDSVLDLVPRR